MKEGTWRWRSQMNEQRIRTTYNLRLLEAKGMIATRKCFLWMFLAFLSNSRSFPLYSSFVKRNRSTIMSASAKAPPPLEPGDVMFGRFIIPAVSIFYRSPQKSVAFVNLRPIVPGHVLIIPGRVVPFMKDLSEEEYLDMWSSVRKVQYALQKEYNCTAFNVAVQDGRAAGQSVPHVHIHILPRSEADFQRNDEIYDHIEKWAPRRDIEDKPRLDVPDDSERRDRTQQEMAEEAAIYRKILEG